jgi:hypothetical protein
MTRKTSLSCDWCQQDCDIDEDETDPIEQGWISLEIYDTIREEVVELDFCCADCAKSYL